jgi:hypothetical protein
MHLCLFLRLLLCHLSLARSARESAGARQHQRTLDIHLLRIRTTTARACVRTTSSCAGALGPNRPLHLPNVPPLLRERDL